MRAVVIANLSGLNGPTSGVVELPHRLFWQPDRRVNLDNPAVLAWMYETVLREAVSADELGAWLDEATLVRIWDDLFLPRNVRAAWEQHHPDLRRQAAA